LKGVERSVRRLWAESGRVVSAESIDCACHGSRFDPATGEVLEVPTRSALPSARITLQGDVIFTR
jgi:nitrite reductase/ring-hydroxylating ferredoxin subunit